MFNGQPESCHRHYWLRLKSPLGGDRALHQCYLAYASDLHILHAGLAPLGMGWADDYLQTASLDHAIWFHDHGRVDAWLLYALMIVKPSSEEHTSELQSLMRISYAVFCWTKKKTTTD